MANVKINQLPNKTSLADTDVVIVESATQTMKMTVGNLKNLLGINQGGVVESGSNANGTFIKFGDGTLICSKSTVINTNDLVEINTPRGGFFRSRFDSQAYPMNFVETFYANFEIAGSTDTSLRSSVYGKKLAYGYSTMAVPNSIWAAPAIFHFNEIVLNEQVTVSFFAIGRWK